MARISKIAQSALLLRLVCFTRGTISTTWSQTKLAPSISGYFTDSRELKYKNSQGFTLMEMLVVVSIVALFVGLALFMDLNSYRGDAFRSEQGALGTALQTARADALNNIDQAKHGVALHPGGYDGYVIFEGNSYATADHSKDEAIASGYSVAFSPMTPTEIIFDQLSGDGSFDGDITIIDPNRNMTAIISINHEGRISW